MACSILCFTVVVEGPHTVVKSRQGVATVPGDAKLGAVLRNMRTARQLTLGAVARQAACAPSLLSYVESGQRRLHPWLAEELDRIYGTGGVIASLMHNTECKPHEKYKCGGLASDIFVALLPKGGIMMPLSRREVLSALAVGVVSGTLQDKFERALENVRLDDDPLKYFGDALSGLQEAARTLAPQRLIDSLLGNVVILDSLRRRAAKNANYHYSILQARYAESLSWLSEEAGDLAGAIYWIDRASQWAQSAGWPGMTAYGLVRRSMVAVSFSGNGRRAVDQARHVLDMQNSSPRIKGLAAKQMAFGYALERDKDASKGALDAAMHWLSQPAREEDSTLGQRSVVDDDLFTIFKATCGIYLGYGSHAISVLEPRLASLSRSSTRTATITRAKLARAYANAGQPIEACRIAWETLDVIGNIGSLSAFSELRRAIPVLKRWRGRSDVQDIMHRFEKPPFYGLR